MHLLGLNMHFYMSLSSIVDQFQGFVPYFKNQTHTTVIYHFSKRSNSFDKAFIHVCKVMSAKPHSLLLDSLEISR